jgi:hypothetical protein
MAEEDSLEAGLILHPYIWINLTLLRILNGDFNLSAF